jgi:hypothetical protein
VSVITKVKKTRQLFQATNEWEPDGVLAKCAHKLEKGKSYAGNLFDAFPGTNETDFEFSKATWATFEADELEESYYGRLLYRPK